MADSAFRVAALGDPLSDAAPRIEDYAFLADCSSAALVRDGSVDWFCAPRLDSASVFGRMLGDQAGHWSIKPVGDYDSDRTYLEDSLVLKTTFRTATGTVDLTDALAFHPEAAGHEIGTRSSHQLVRLIEGVRGSVELAMEFVPRPEYGLQVPHLLPCRTGVRLISGPSAYHLLTTIALVVYNSSAHSTFSISAGQTMGATLQLTSSRAPRPLTPDAGALICDTVSAWRSWMKLHLNYEGMFAHQVRQSALVLQGLTYAPTGAVAGAATTSLPEAMGEGANWDYRFVWLRDFSLTVRALYIAACPDEPIKFLRWISEALGEVGEERIQIVYGVQGERDLTERELDHLEGFRSSRPVRIGNEVWKQKQLDVLGEVLDAAYQLRDYLGNLDEDLRRLLICFADRAASQWRETDQGMWEGREEGLHYTSSKVMCWVALDRAVRLAPLLGTGAHVETWIAEREACREAILANAWDEKVGAYTGAFDSDHLDASVLVMPLVEFLPMSDERMSRTVEVLIEKLGGSGILKRWDSDPGGFILCNFWLAECLALGGDLERAQKWFTAAADHANDLGLLAEQVDLRTDDLTGNFPQAFSHVGLINAAWRLTELQKINDAAK